MAAMTFTDLSKKFRKRDKTVVLKLDAVVTPTLRLLMNSPTNLVQQLKQNNADLDFTFKRVGNDLHIIATVKKALEPPAQKRLPSKKPSR